MIVSYRYYTDYSHIKVRAIFHDWASLWDALIEHWNNKSIPGFGDWSPIINDLDPFRDGKASQHMTTYLSWLIEGLKQGLNRDTVMADAAELYAKKWDYDKVVYMS